MNTRRLVTDAVLIALYVVLNFYTIRLGWLNISLAAFPILVAALLYGWADGLIVGAMSGFISQLLTYGAPSDAAFFCGRPDFLYPAKKRPDPSGRKDGIHERGFGEKSTADPFLRPAGQ